MLKTQLFQAVITGVSWLSLSGQHKLGTFIGRVFWRFSKRERNVTRINLALCFPKKTLEWRDELGKRSLIETGKTLAETGAMWRWPEAKLRALIKQIHHEEIIKDAVAQGKGVILVSPHIGAWELISLYFNQHYPMVNMYRPARSTTLDPIIRQARERFGSNTAPANAQGLRAILKGLKGGKIIGILPDQEPDRKNGVFAPFFGTPACTMTLLGNLANKTSAPVVFCVMKRESTGYELYFVKPDDSISSKDAVVAASAVNRSVECCINIAPEQYLWSYKRFRLLDDGNKRDYEYLDN